MATIKSIKEKAKAYDEAIEVAQRFYNNSVAITKKGLEDIFPELKESEDEKIRKVLIDYFDSANKGDENPLMLYGIQTDKVITWLEKQGEQKPADKIESRQEELTEFEKAVKQVMEEAIECGDTHNLKADADMLLRLVQKSSWSEEDEVGLCDAMWAIEQARTIAKDENDMGNLWYAERWLKSLRPQNRWKPSERQLECLGYAIEKAEKDWSPLTNNRVYLTLKALKEQLLELRGSKV